MPEYVYGYAIRRGRLLKRAAALYDAVPGKDGYTLDDVLIGSFTNLARDAEIYGKVLLRYTEINGEDEMVMALASNKITNRLPTYPSLPDPKDVERLRTLLEYKNPPQWYRAC